MRRILLACSLASPLAACVEPPVDDAFIDQRVSPPPPPAEGEGIQIVTPELSIEPGTDVMWCYVPAFSPDEDVLVKGASGLQGASGHHIVLLQSGIPREPGTTFDCTQSEAMASLRPLIVPTTEVNEGLGILPEGFAIRMKAGAQIVMQSHYVNVADKPLKVQDSVNLEFADAADGLVEASYWVENVADLDVPPGPHTVSRECVVDEETRLLFLLGHMHEWGTSFKLERDSGEGLETIYEVERWTTEYRDLPPTNVYDAEDPLVLAAGDRVRITCAYDNGTDGNLRFPSEMCTAFGTYFPARGEGFLLCDPVAP